MFPVKLGKMSSAITMTSSLSFLATLELDTSTSRIESIEGSLKALSKLITGKSFVSFC